MAFFLASPRRPRNSAHKSQEALHGHVGVSRGVFREIANQPLGRNGVLDHVKPPTRDLALRRRNEPGDHAHGGGFAGAIGPQKTQHFAPLHRKRNMVNGQFWAERLLKFSTLIIPILVPRSRQETPRIHKLN